MQHTLRFTPEISTVELQAGLAGRIPAYRKYAQMAGLILLAIMIRTALLPLESSDYRLFVHRWLEYISLHGGHRALGYGFSNYEPAYTYLLVVASYLRPALPDLVLVKALCLPFEILAAWAGMEIAGIVTGRSGQKVEGWPIFLGFLLLPTVMLNNAGWGQCDVIYAGFLLLSFRSSLLEKPYATALWFGAALAFKFQAMFFAPYLLLLLVTRRISIKHLFLAPCVPVLFAIPAILEGRSAIEIARVFFDQAGTYSQLALNVANPWEVVQVWGRSGGILGTVAYLVTVSAIGFYIFKGRQQRRITARWLLVAASLGTALMPFFLPKMHDRYFFPAELLCAALAFTVPAFRIPAALMQIASICVYSNFMWDLDHHPKMHAGLIAIAVCANSCALALLARQFFTWKSGNTTGGHKRDGLPEVYILDLEWDRNRRKSAASKAKLSRVEVERITE